jgi:hypothetical protein
LVVIVATTFVSHTWLFVRQLLNALVTGMRYPWPVTALKEGVRVGEEGADPRFAAFIGFR